MTIAKYNQPSQIAMQGMSQHHRRLTLDASVVKPRWTVSARAVAASRG
jgi:hypothetical protein